MKKIFAPLIAAAFVAGAVVVLPAQAAADAHAREGFYASLGIAYGAPTCTNCTFPSGIAGYIALGGTVNPHLRLGFEGDTWSGSQSGVTLTLAYYGLSASIYPSVENNLWFKVNGGWTNMAASGFGSSSSTSGGAAAGIGVGYDWMPGKGKLALIPYANYMLQLTSSSTEDKVNLFQIGLAIGYRH